MAKKYKIAFLSYYSGNVNRGAETYVSELSSALADRGHEITVFQNGSPELKMNYQIVSFNNSCSSLLSFALKCLGRIDRRTDIIISNNGREQNLVLKIWCTLNRIKLIIPGHSGIGFDDRLNLLLFPDVFIALSDHQNRWANKINKFVKIVKISDGVNTLKFNREVSPLTLGLTHPIILYTAALETIKRQDLVIKAVANLKEASLLLVGSGSKKEEIYNLGRKLLGKRFDIMSFSYDQMPSVYVGADLFTYPTSPWEASGLSIYEAMASGLPVVASDDPIRREIIDKAGLVVDPTDVEQYTLTLQKALQTNWDDKPRQRALSASWDSIAIQYEKLFDTLI